MKEHYTKSFIAIPIHQNEANKRILNKSFIEFLIQQKREKRYQTKNTQRLQKLEKEIFQIHFKYFSALYLWSRLNLHF